METAKSLKIAFRPIKCNGIACSPAEKAGIQENDIILEFNGEKITTDNSLAKIIMKYKPGDAVILKVLRGKEEKTLTVVLGEHPE